MHTNTQAQVIILHTAALSHSGLKLHTIQNTDVSFYILEWTLLISPDWLAEDDSNVLQFNTNFTAQAIIVATWQPAIDLRENA